MTLRVIAAGLAAGMFAGGASAAPGCTEIVQQYLADKATDVVCFHSQDLTTVNPVTTPANNSLPGVVPFAFTPITDRGVISNGPAPITHAVPGFQVEGYFADDPEHQARFVLRFPDTWNGRLVVAGASGTRSEYNGDFAWSDYVLSQGYAYASQNKGVFNLKLSAATDPLGCRLNPDSPTFVHFFDNDPAKPFTQWTDYMLRTAKLAQGAVKFTYHQPARYTYAVGTSNGGYQVRRAIEAAPDLFDGGVDWEGTFIDAAGPNILIDLPPAIANYPAYAASGFDATSAAAQAIRNAGYPPDIVNAGGKSLWQQYSGSFWEVTACQWQKRFDPTYDTYGAGLGNYDYLGRITLPGVFDSVAAVATTGKIKKPLITVAGTMDALLPIQRQARAYEAKVNASRKGNNDERNAQYRLYEVQNGNHIEAYKFLFPQLELIQPHAQKAFDLLVQHVESKAALPESQCIPHAGTISAAPAEPGHCANLFVP